MRVIPVDLHCEEEDRNPKKKKEERKRQTDELTKLRGQTRQIQ